MSNPLNNFSPTTVLELTLTSFFIIAGYVFDGLEYATRAAHIIGWITREICYICGIISALAAASPFIKEAVNNFVKNLFK